MYGIAAESTSQRATATGVKTSPAKQKAIAVAAGMSRRPASAMFHAACSAAAPSARSSAFGGHLEHDRDRTVVHELDRHPRAEAAGLDADARLAKGGAERLVQLLGVLGSRGLGEARPVPLRRV